MKALILVANGFEELSFFLPWYRLKEEGVDVTIATPLMHGLEGQHGYKIEADAPLREVNTEEYDLLILPDGIAAEKLRLRNEAVDLARTFVESGRWVAAIGHGPQVLISAGALDGKTVTCSPGIRDDVRAAGAIYRDESTILDGGLLTCRGTDDLPEFCRRLMALLKSPATPVLRRD
jgi:protease I